MNSSFLPGIQVLARGSAPTPSLSAQQAVAAAARALDIPAPGALTVLKAGSAAEGMEFSDGGISSDKIPVKLMYLPMPNGSLRLVWDVTLAPRSGVHYWNARVDASTGVLLDKTDFNVSENFSMLSLTRPLSIAAAVATTPTARPTATPNSYNVWPLTVESPMHGARQLVTNPADKKFSPFGWHDTNGAAGAEYTITRGNNVYAYDDPDDDNNSKGKNFSPDGGADLIFDFPFDDKRATLANTNLSAAVTNLFYWNNLMHDVMAHKGFDEASGNFQTTNYTTKGLGKDEVQAEAQDKSGLTPPTLGNANFGTPADGMKPRMQMYLWDESVADAVITGPANLAGDIKATEGAFTVPIAKIGPISGSLVLAADGTTTPTFGCAPYANAAAVKGNIAVVDRGTCTFLVKVQQAQAAGAKMVIIINNNADQAPFGFVGDTTGIRIPGLMIGLVDGNRIKQALAAGTPVQMSFSGEVKTFYRDGDFDNGIIAHEYGHGISNRLTGGADKSNCLTNQEQMGEGWSDFFALWMTTKPGDIGATGRGIGTYASFQETNGIGIRPTRYSTDFKINPSTYKLIGTENYGTYQDADNRTRVYVHSIGYVWASALWDLNWALIEKYGYEQNLTAATGGNNIALKLVIDGLKLQPCSPGFLDGRDAILKADMLNNNGANTDLIWKVFARRGMGFSAKQGSSNVVTDQTPAFDTPPLTGVGKQLSGALLDVYPNPASEQVLIRTQVNSAVPVQVELLTILGQRVFDQTISAARLQQDGLTVNTSTIAPGLYVVRLTTSEGTLTKKLVVQH